MRRVGAVVSLLVVAVAVGPVSGAVAAAAGCRHWEGDPTTPCLVLTPASGPIGTHVTFRGSVRPDLISRYDEEWHSSTALYGLTGEFPASRRFPNGCELIVAARGLRISLDTTTGLVRGSFTVGRAGTCFQAAGTADATTRHPTMPGRYSLFVGSLSTYIASFHVTRGRAVAHVTTPSVAPRTHAHAHPHTQSAPSQLPFSGAPVLPMGLLAAAVLCVGVALIGIPTAAPAGRHRRLSR